MKKKPDIVYIIVNVLCLALLIADIELKNYFSHLNLSYTHYLYPSIMINLAGPMIVCLLIVYRQSRHQKASLSTKNRHRFMPGRHLSDIQFHSVPA